MISLNSISFSYTHKPIFNNASIIFNDTISGLVGKNGSGKTTLFEIISGELKLNSGEIVFPLHSKIGYLKQQIKFSNININCIDFVLNSIDIYREYNELLKLLENNSSKQLLKRMSKVEEIYRINNGYNMKEELIKVLIGLGLDNPQNININELSYGYKMRLMLAKLLIENNDILLLDEPTNHLDLPSIKWLIDYIRHIDKTVIIVSHDRFFLDCLVREIVEIENAKLKKYKGNYSYYKKVKKEIEEHVKKEYNNLLNEKKRLEILINKFKAKNTKSSMAHSKEKIIKRIEQKLQGVELNNNNKQMKLNSKHESFFKADIAIKILIKEKKYKDRVILNNINIEIAPNEKIFLIGRNGIGKSTFLRIVRGIDNEFNGNIKYHNKLKIFYFSFDELERMDEQLTIYEYLKQYSIDDFQIKSALGAMLFYEEDYEKKINVLSGGERIRLYMSRLFSDSFNYIMLDEPTNYLDIESIDILSQWLKKINCGFIIVTHNEYLLKYVDNGEIWQIINGNIKRTFDNYINFEYRDNDSIVKGTKHKKDTNKQKKQKILQKRVMYNKLIKKEEEIIEMLEINRENIYKKLSEEYAYKKYNIKELTIELNNIDKKIKEHYSKWEKLIQEKPEFD